jgi:hypothetical protein
VSKPQTEIIRPKDTLCVCVSMPASADLGFLDERTLNCLVLEWSRCAGCDGCRVPACKRCIPNCKREFMCVFVCVCVCVCVCRYAYRCGSMCCEDGGAHGGAADDTLSGLLVCSYDHAHK